MDKLYLVFAGVNGAGKTTLYRAARWSAVDHRINPDEIGRGHGWDWRDATANFKAGMEAVALLEKAFSQGESICQETTLSGHSVVNRILKAKAMGYRIEMHYVGLESAEIAKRRIAHRVATGGHGIPDAAVERRYGNSLANVAKVAPMIDTLYFYDNSRDLAIVQMAECAHGALIDETPPLPQWFVGLKEALKRK